jgi:hypothetical protein
MMPTVAADRFRAWGELLELHDCVCIFKIGEARRHCIDRR